MDDTFARQMNELAAQAEKQPPTGPPVRAEGDPAAPPAAAIPTLSLQPVTLGLEAMGRGVTETNRLLVKLSADLADRAAAPGAAPSESEEKMAKSVEWIHAQLHRQAQVESANQKLFDAMHGELKTYKDAFLFDALHKPFVKDLLRLADDVGAIERQVKARMDEAETGEAAEKEFLSKLQTNLGNAGAHFLEVFARLEVETFESVPGVAVDRQRHKTISIEPASGAAQDQTVARSLKPGSLWRGRVIRPEEVVVRRWTAPKAPPNGDAEASH